MQRQQLWLSVVVWAGIFVAWTAYMGYANTRVTTLDVNVAGAVDEVRFYKASDPEHAFAQITTGGAAATQSITFRTSARYSFLAQTPPAEVYFVAQAGAETFESPAVCCTLGLADARRSLTINSLTEWAAAP